MAMTPHPKRMTVPLQRYSAIDVNTEFAQDLGPCDHCSGCRSDITDMVASSNATACVFCNKRGRLLKCSACNDVQYCSRPCQKSDWDMHKLICKKLWYYTADSKPSVSHFRVIVFPHLAAQPEFTWGFVNEKTELVVEHPSIADWKKAMRNRYEKNDRDPLIVHALSRDHAMEGKMLGHAVRVASWQPPNGPSGHLEGFNDTLLSLTGVMRGRYYGPLVAFAYKLNPEFNYAGMNDMSTKDFRHLLDYFNNSNWNPMIGDIDRHPGKTTPALFIPDPVFPDGNKQRHLSICHVVNTHNPVLEVNVVANIPLPQTCWHAMCDPMTSPLKQFCPSGLMWSSFLLGPLLLELPWIGRNAILTDIHNTGSRKSLPPGRVSVSYARFLSRSMRIGYRCITADVLTMSDGMLVFDAFGHKIDPLHLLAYDEFMVRQFHTEEKKRDCSKKNFMKFWTGLKTGKDKIMNQNEAHQHLSFSGVESPYSETTNASTILAEDASKIFLHLRMLFKNKDFRAMDEVWVDALFNQGARRARWSLNEKYWSVNVDKMFKGFIKGYTAEEDQENVEEVATNVQPGPGLQDTQQKVNEVATVAEASTGESLDLAKLAAATLDIMKE
ncbi:hypothetical protein FBEOM_9 [Fusarium beomiforme]|uniref:MYND-type domain-containing protein n=1 Tax=Fusarium beomiforme TaxID=44412 RepID=A0A9P5B1L1_9HYPO|nr:hypothetical protein FBEOM_9 [Fusarium beomiforme]